MPSQIKYAACAVALFVGFFLILDKGIKANNRAQNRMQRLVAEARSIPPPTSAKESYFLPGHKLFQASVFAGYNSPLGQEEIVRYYDDSFKAMGWRLIEQYPARPSGYWKGAISHIFQKQDMFVDFQYNGKRERSDEPQFLTSYTWGLH